MEYQFEMEYRFEFWDRGDGTVELDVDETDIDALISFFDLSELKELKEYNIKIENYEGVELLRKTIEKACI